MSRIDSLKLEEKYEIVKAHLEMRTRNTLNPSSRYTINEVLTSTDAAVIVPNIVIGAIREAMEPLYVLGSMLPEITLEKGVSIEFPSIGVLRAHFVDELGEYRQDYLDIQRHRQSLDVRVRKFGLMIELSDELIEDAQWDVVGLHMKAAGQAMARFKEEWLFHEFNKFGHVVFDNSLPGTDAHTTGVGPTGSPNNTLSPFDFIDMYYAMHANGFIPTTLLIHPLAWSVFAKNEILGSLGQQIVHVTQNLAKPIRDLKLPSVGANQLPTAFARANDGAEVISRNLPLPLEVIPTPFAPIDLINKTFDMYLIDRNAVGCWVVKSDMEIEEFKDPRKDVQSMRIRERRAPGIFNEGRAISVAKNISLQPSYNPALLVKTI